MEIIHGDLCPADSATQTAFITAANAFAALRPDPVLSSLIHEVECQRRAVTRCPACCSIEYPVSSEVSNDHNDLQTVYRFLRFEGFMQAADHEEIPQRARALAQGIMFRIIKHTPSPNHICSICSINACKGTGNYSVTYCGHIFHKDCLFKFTTKHGDWNKSHQLHCPKCSGLILSLHSPGAAGFSAVKKRWEEEHNSKDAAILITIYNSHNDTSKAQVVAHKMIGTIRTEISADRFTQDSLTNMIIFMWIDIKLSGNPGAAKEEATQNLDFARGASEILMSRSEDLIEVDTDWKFYEDFTVEGLCEELECDERTSEN